MPDQRCAPAVYRQSAGSQQWPQIRIVCLTPKTSTTRASTFDGFLDLASDHSLFHLACGSRFFALLVLARESPLPGRTYGRCQVPSAYRRLNAMKRGFLE